MPLEDKKEPIDPKSFLLPKKDAPQAPATPAGASASAPASEPKPVVPTAPHPEAPKPATPPAATPAPAQAPKPAAAPVAPAPAAPAPQRSAPQPAAPAPAIDPKSILLPKEDKGPSLDSAQRVSASVLFEQEAKAKAEPLTPPIGELSVPHAPPPPKPPEESVVKAIQTYGSDINAVVREGKVSVAAIAAAEAERRARATSGEPVAPEGIAPSEESSPMRPVLIIAGAVLMLCAVGLTAALLLRPAPTVVQKLGGQAPFVQVDDSMLITVKPGESRDTLMTTLEAAREQVNLSVGLVDWLYVAQATTTGEMPDPLPIDQFLALIAPDAPQDLVRSLSGQYLLGVHSYDQNQAFLLLRVDSYQQAYAAMLAWEPTMRQDLLPLFGRTPPLHVQNSDATTTPVATAPEVLNTGFTDKVVDNHDARTVTTREGDLLLLWTFLDRNTLVITTNEYTLSEVIRRTNTSSVVPQP